MKTPTVILVGVSLLFLWMSAGAQSKDAVMYDSLLARKLGADQYGMKTYVMAFLKAGPIQLKDTAARAKLQKAHLQNIMRMAAAGKLIIAGPFLDNQAIRGIYLFDVRSIDEARELTASDPAIQAGTLEMELHPWYGSAALMELLRLHRQIEKKSVAE